MATLSVQTSARAANDLSMTAADAGGDDFDNSDNPLVLIKNDDTSSIDVTFTTTITVDGESVDDKTITVGAGEIALLGPWPGGTYDDADGKVSIGYTSVTSVTVAAIRAM